MEILFDLAVLASEEYVPPTDWRAQIALPMAVLILLGGIFVLLRSNLGTRRAYLVQASSFFGFMLLLSMFWAFGAPGTPPYTGPQNLPGQPIDYYQPKWVPFAEDSIVAEQPEYEAVQGYPDTFQEPPPEQQSLANDGAGEVVEFFTSDPDDPDATGWVVPGDWVVSETLYTEAENGRPLVAVEMSEPDPDNILEPAPDGDTYVAFAFFDEGNLLLPSLVFIVLSAIGFVLHVVLLAWDERQERRDLEEDLAAEKEERERVPTPA